MRSLSLSQGPSHQTEKTIDLVASTVLALSLPLLSAGLGLVDSVSIGVTPVALYVGGLGMLYAYMTVKSLTGAYKALKNNVTIECAWYTLLPTTVVFAAVSHNTLLMKPYEIGLQIGLTLYDQGF